MQQDITALIGSKLLTTQVVGNDHVIFTCQDGSRFEMYHDQDCCERVHLEDISEDWDYVLNDATVVEAYESTNSFDPPLDDYCVESYTWTFYRIITNKGAVVMRWYGTSNGYYSERVSIYKIDND